jgi:murein DD-endopeptidase MepM/ murein hydrolase activator NlpD
LPIIAIAACSTKEPGITHYPTEFEKTVSQKKVLECIKEKSSYSYNKFHIMKKGETLYRISKRYNVSIKELIEINNIDDHTDIKIGKIILIPGAEFSEFQWPVKGLLTSGFGNRGRKLHSGIDISADKGTPIKSIADGLIVNSSNKLKGYRKYGKVVIIDHGMGITSLYAHNKKNLVKAGTCVRKGQIVAEVGSSGNATGNHLHIEIRRHGKPVNPLIYLEH